MKIYKISTSAWIEENFLILTTLTKSKILKVIKPMVKEERENDFFYYNDDYVNELKKKYKNDFIMIQNDSEIDFINF